MKHQAEINSSLFRDRHSGKILGYTDEAVFRSFCSLGGRNGWGAYDILWVIRGLADKLLGGRGITRERRHPYELREGDLLDFWRVADAVQAKRLLLSADMKLPGKAWLEFLLADGEIIQTAYFQPGGIIGRLYWYAMVPFHKLIFRKMVKDIISGAENFSD